MTYSDYVSLVLHADRIRIRKLADMADAVAIGTGAKTMPDEWIDLLTDDPEERAKWKHSEFRRGL